MISVQICPPSLRIATQWDDLVRRASSNVFMNPAALQAACELDFAEIQMLLAWEEGATPARLVGLWALQLRKISPLWPALLEALPYEYAFLSSPVVDPAFVTEVMPAFLAAVADSKLPNVISLRQFDTECPSYGPMIAALAARGQRPLQLEASQRPIVTREFGVKKSGSTRKKLRQDWNRLSAIGFVEVVNDRPAGQVREAFESFLTLEAAGWKGARGTAVLSNPDDAIFVRRLIGVLADRGNASVALLRVDQRVIAAQVLLYCGATAYTWKIAYDRDYARYSPGALLVDKVTEGLFAIPAGIESINSCSDGTGFMAQLWAGRRSMADLLINVAPRYSAAFVLEGVRLRAYYRLRVLRNRLRARNWLSRPQRKAGPEAPGSAPSIIPG
ncbi:MAG TPA: GNAT family N-acetyltransferase [Tardiphaga sp.]